MPEVTFCGLASDPHHTARQENLLRSLDKGKQDDKRQPSKAKCVVPGEPVASYHCPARPSACQLFIKNAALTSG